MGKISFSKETVQTETPVPGVQVECVNTHANIPALTGDDASAPVKVSEAVVVDTTPANCIPSAPVGSALPAVIAPVNPPAVTDSPFAFNDEDIGFEDIRLPRLNIVHKVGGLSKVFEPGEITLNGSIVIHTPKNPNKNIAGTEPLIFTVLGFRKKQYVEKVENYGVDDGMMVGTREEVVAAGGTLDYKEWAASKAAAKAGAGKAKRRFETLATALILVQKPSQIPDDSRVIFPHECEGKFYSLCLWGMKGSAYTNAAKHIFTARRLGHLIPGYHTQAWSLTTKMDIAGENEYPVPVITPAAKASPAMLAFVARILGAGN